MFVKKKSTAKLKNEVVVVVVGGGQRWENDFVERVKISFENMPSKEKNPNV